MEGTAAWMEDEVYERVNDNLQYLSRSPLAYPSIPLDHTGYGYGPYGSWVFWKFLSEWSGRAGADDPDIVRRVWESATGSPYSAQALARVLRSRHRSFATAFAAFG